MPDLETGRGVMARIPLLICALFAAALLAVIVAPSIDLIVSGWFYAGGHFTLDGNPVLEFMHQTAIRGAWGLGFLFVTMIIVSFIIKKHRHPGESRDPALAKASIRALCRADALRWIPAFAGMATATRGWLFLLLTLLIGPVLIANGILKDHWGRERPHEIVEFGGADHFSAALVPQTEASRNGSFISGDGAFGFYLPCFAYLLPLPQRRRESRWVFWVAMATGCAFAFSRIAMGSHFLSDNLFAALFMTLSNAALHAALFGRQQTRGYWRVWLNLDRA